MTSAADLEPVAGEAVLDVPVEAAENLPFADDAFDHVTSTFGVQFAPRHDLVAAELVRVCRPGGTIRLVNWTPEGLMGELLAIVARHVPPLPDLASPPPLWGSEQHVRELFGDALKLTFTRGLHEWRFASPDEYVASMETHDSLVRARAYLGDRWERCRNEILAMVERRNEAGDGRLELYAEYLVIVAHKPQ
jgi:SAM-dependent methyltransferase